MIIKKMWRNCNQDFKDFYEAEEGYCVFAFITLILGTPLFIILDMLLMPFYLLYFLVYKRIMLRGKSNE